MTPIEQAMRLILTKATPEELTRFKGVLEAVDKSGQQPRVPAGSGHGGEFASGHGGGGGGLLKVGTEVYARTHGGEVERGKIIRVHPQSPIPYVVLFGEGTRYEGTLQMSANDVKLKPEEV